MLGTIYNMEFYILVLADYWQIITLIVKDSNEGKLMYLEVLPPPNC